jgi:hypothetical protein
MSHYSVLLSHNGADEPVLEALDKRLILARFQPWLDK